MGRIALCIFVVLIILHLGTFLTYGLLGSAVGLQAPQDVSPAAMFLSVFIMKLGHAIVFVLLFYFARGSLKGRWLLYASLWWLMFAMNEAGQAMGPGYSWTEALLGILAETIYFPVSAVVTNRMVGARS